MEDKVCKYQLRGYTLYLFLDSFYALHDSVLSINILYVRPIKTNSPPIIVPFDIIPDQ